MGLFKRLSASLFAPREVINYRKDKWYTTILYFLFLLLLMLLPITTIVLKKDLISYDFQKLIRDAFNGETVPFEIVDGILVHKEDDTTYVYEKELQSGMNIIITAKDDADISSSLKNINIVFTSKDIYIKQTMIAYKLTSYTNYEQLKNIDLSKAGSYNNTEFWGTIFAAAETELVKFQPFIKIISIVYYALESIFNLVLISLALALIQSLGRTKVIRFREVWKICIYLMAPYTMGYVLYILFSNILLYYLGFGLSAIYVLIVNKHLQSEIMRRKNNEL